jgi:hypothetical protein
MTARENEPPADESSRQETVALVQSYGMDERLTEALRQAFRDAKRLAPQHRRLADLLHGLARRPESEARQTVQEITRLAKTLHQGEP